MHFVVITLGKSI